MAQLNIFGFEHILFGDQKCHLTIPASIGKQIKLSPIQCSAWLIDVILTRTVSSRHELT